jgi:diaminopimelate epimerase
MKIPFTKAHGAKNDVLLTWAAQCPRVDAARAAAAICDRHTGIGADGWYLIEPADDADAAVRLYNSDGSAAEVSGNGTRCVAALLVEEGRAAEQVKVRTGAGLKSLRLMGREGGEYLFEMNMGPAESIDRRSLFARDVTTVWVGNPQCAVFVDDFDFDWQSLGAAMERHPQFPNRTNVSFVRAVDPHTIEIRFFERGAGTTMSSGTGSTGAAAAARHRGLVESPVTVLTEAGPLELRWEGEDMLLTGPARLVGRGEFFLD